MKLLINAESLRPPLTGIDNYTVNLLNACNSGSRSKLSTIFPASTSHRFKRPSAAASMPARPPMPSTARKRTVRWRSG
ncbi:hypothetical protein [Stutzerimonas kunmingensis]|uniref:hypothetical protein n=1 Tax=Stutzerimonas kunmingensis TaxID=1211807 RepID=UPI0028AAD8B4|nr:hypothetical protein [Stutzerimonas kunmingensis]